MPSIVKAILVTLTFVSGAMAQADQCQLVEKDYAQKAMNLLSDRIDTGDNVVKWCEPCGEPRPASDAAGEPINAVGIEKSGYGDYFYIVVNGEAVDLAYTFIGEVNLAVYINQKTGLKAETADNACDLSGVSDTL